MPGANTSFHESPLELFANVVRGADGGWLPSPGVQLRGVRERGRELYAEPFDELSTVDAETLERAEAIARGACHG